MCLTGWWFQIFFMFTPTWGNDPIWLIFFKWVETTNQLIILEHNRLWQVSGQMNRKPAASWIYMLQKLTSMPSFTPSFTPFNQLVCLWANRMYIHTTYEKLLHLLQIYHGFFTLVSHKNIPQKNPWGNDGNVDLPGPASSSSYSQMRSGPGVSFITSYEGHLGSIFSVSVRWLDP